MGLEIARAIFPPIGNFTESPERDIFLFCAHHDGIDTVSFVIYQHNQPIFEMTHSEHLRCGDSITIDLPPILNVEECSFVLVATRTGEDIQNINGPLSKLPEQFYL